MNRFLIHEEWPVEAPADPADSKTLRKKLQEFNITCSAIDQGQDLGIFLRDDQGEMVAGTYGWLWGNCLEIVLLWVHEELRGQGIGQRLIGQIENAGMERGGRVAMLETFSFQAPGFYKRLGYEAFGVIEGYGGRYAKHFMRKELR